MKETLSALIGMFLMFILGLLLGMVFVMEAFDLEAREDIIVHCEIHAQGPCELRAVPVLTYGN